jgi:hypothetical protein
LLSFEMISQRWCSLRHFPFGFFDIVVKHNRFGSDKSKVCTNHASSSCIFKQKTTIMWSKGGHEMFHFSLIWNSHIIFLFGHKELGNTSRLESFPKCTISFGKFLGARQQLKSTLYFM